MPTMGKYCKAYPIERFRQFSGWTERSENSRKEKRQSDGGETEVPRDLNDHLYLQENYIVTDGIFIDQNVIFDNVTPEWVNYCKETLKFEVPVQEPVSSNESGS